jgi:hypothetical protein
MRSDVEIRHFIIGAMRQYGGSPPALLNVLTGYVAQLQELMKRDTEDQFVEKACQGLHPGRMAQGLYCKLCHDIEMAGTYGGLPPEAQPKEGKSSPEEDLELMDVKIDPLKE